MCGGRKRAREFCSFQVFPSIFHFNPAAVAILSLFITFYSRSFDALAPSSSNEILSLLEIANFHHFSVWFTVSPYSPSTSHVNHAIFSRLCVFLFVVIKLYHRERSSFLCNSFDATCIGFCDEPPICFICGCIGDGSGLGFLR